MLNNASNKLPILDHRLQHLGYRLFFKHPVLLTLDRQADVDGTALGRRDLSIEAVLGEVDLSGIRRVDLDHRRGAGDLDSEGGRRGDGDGGDDGFDEDGGLHAVIYMRKFDVSSETNRGKRERDVQMVTALTFPLITTVVFLHPKMLTLWLILVSSTVTVSPS